MKDPAADEVDPGSSPTFKALHSKDNCLDLAALEAEPHRPIKPELSKDNFSTTEKTVQDGASHSTPQHVYLGSVARLEDHHDAEDMSKQSNPVGSQSIQTPFLPSFQVALPDISGQPDPEGVLTRRLQKYQSYIATDSVMQLLPEIDESLFSGEQRPHLKYYIKTVATIKCDVCEQKCKKASEVYQCRECTAQVCRECVEDKLTKEQSAKGATPFVWIDKRHEPFKVAYSIRKDSADDIYGHGDWAGDVEVSGFKGTVHVTLELPPHKKRDSKISKKRKTSSAVDDKESTTATFDTSSSPSRKQTPARKRSTTDIEEADQRYHIQHQSMKSGSIRKLDRIRQLALKAQNRKATPPSPAMADAANRILALSAEDQVGRCLPAEFTRASPDPQVVTPDPDIDGSHTHQAYSSAATNGRTHSDRTTPTKLQTRQSTPESTVSSKPMKASSYQKRIQNPESDHLNISHLENQTSNQTKSPLSSTTRRWNLLPPPLPSTSVTTAQHPNPEHHTFQ